MVAQLRASGADVVLFRFADVMARLPGQRARRAAGDRCSTPAVGETAERHGAILVDLYADDTFLNPMLWSTDRLHLSPAGHRRVAGQVLDRARRRLRRGVVAGPAAPGADAVALARAADLRWAGQHLAPWVKRRLTGRSSGDTVTAKRPTLGPLTD